MLASLIAMFSIYIYTDNSLDPILKDAFTINDLDNFDLSYNERQWLIENPIFIYIWNTVIRLMLTFDSILFSFLTWLSLISIFIVSLLNTIITTLFAYIGFYKITQENNLNS